MLSGVKERAGSVEEIGGGEEKRADWSGDQGENWVVRTGNSC